MAIEANTPKDWGMRGATNTTLPQFKGKSRQLIINIDDGYRPVIMDGITLGGRFKCASLDEVATKLDKGAKAESAKVADSVNGANVSGTVANATNAVNATNATKATQDSLGRVISDTYATKGELEGIDTYASKEDIISAAETALTGATPVSAGDPTLDEIKTAIADLQADVGAIPTPNAYIVETWKSGSDWYRVWSNGFIEQAVYVASKTWSASTNVTTVSLQKAYKNNSYTVLLQPGTGMGANECEFWVKVKNTSSIGVSLTAYQGYSQTSGLMVYACGY